MKFKLSILLLVVIKLSLWGGSTNISTKTALSKYNKQLTSKVFVAFIQVGENPLKWFDSIPENCLIRSMNNNMVKLNANPGEIFVFQVGVWALHSEQKDVQINFEAFRGNKATIAPNKFTCYNTGGINFSGVQFSKKINIPGGRVQALWIGVDLENTPHDSYTGIIKISTNGKEQKIPLELVVSGENIPDNRYGRGAGLSRLNWLNSTIGMNEQITKGYTQVKRDGNLLSILGRSVTISENGLPSSVNTFFEPSNERLSLKGEPVVSNPFRFIIEKENGEKIQLKPGNLTYNRHSPSCIYWTVVNSSPEVDLKCSGQLEYDGFMDFRLELTAKKPLKIKDIRLEIPFECEKAEYMMGLNHEGGYRTPDWKWKWDIANNQDMLWIGAVNGGMRIKWKAENYVRPLVNIYYEFGPLKLPPSWGNEGKGGVNVNEKNNNVLVNAYSGARSMKKGEHLNFDFELLITPLKTIDRNKKFNDRYYHGGGTNTSIKIVDAQKAGANIINIHHAEDIYPFINYPYLDENVKELSKLVSEAHQNNKKIKFYYTTRELTKNLPEFWAFNSLNGEIIFPGPGNTTRTEALHPNGPNEWLVKNLREKYIPAWYNPVNEGRFKGELDLSVITTPDSRLNNFYIAGLDWMVRNIGIDGVYIDDSALDHSTLRRARKVIDASCPEGRIDLHSWNHYSKWAGFASSLNLYMDLLPYVDLVWIGEARNYNRQADHWLIEVSGIPFGLPGQMLEGGGNPWRGMVFGITTRAGWTPNSPADLWKFFDQHHFADRNLLGYWDKDCPVKCTDPNIKVSVFKGNLDAIVAVANWSDKDQKVCLIPDMAKLGITGNTSITIPAIPGFQDKNDNPGIEELIVPAGKGFLIVFKSKNNSSVGTESW